MPDRPETYLAEAVLENGQMADINLVWPGRSWRLLGRGGPDRERKLFAGQDQGSLTVVLGSGLGYGLEALLAGRTADQPVAVIDREGGILALTGLRERYQDDARLLWLDAEDPDQIMASLTDWQNAHHGRPFRVVANPVYLRINPDYYAALQARLEVSRQVNFWEQARYKKFASWPPRILLITSSYFLMGEMIAACQRLSVPHRFLRVVDEEVGQADFVQALLTQVIDFKPDFIFTLNHLGLDREGVLADLLERLQLPLASWFVDNPHLILYLYEGLNSPWTAIYTWDADNLESLAKRGFKQVRYLPLGTDIHRFHPGAPPIFRPRRNSEVAFVGNSMEYKVGLKLKKGRFPRPLLLTYKEVARRFKDHPEQSVQALLETDFPELLPWFESLGTVERKLDYEVVITHEATRQYRRDCVAEILPFHPLIAGDDGWTMIFRQCRDQWDYRPELSYYDELPGFYPCNKINFNCTSTQMKGAVNQRVFDVPATGSFILTDWRVQIENLFEPGREVACYQHPGEIPDLIRFYLAHPGERQRIAQAARARILAQHTYDHRLKELMQSMRDIYG